jgi:hypothetical protein
MPYRCNGKQGTFPFVQEIYSGTLRVETSICGLFSAHGTDRSLSSVRTFLNHEVRAVLSLLIASTDMSRRVVTDFFSTTEMGL